MSGTQINLVWTASIDNVGVTQYKVYRGVVLLTTLGTATSYSNSGLNAGATYSYSVAACDAANNCSLTHPATGTIATNLTTLWTWDSAKSGWYFYAPSLDANGTLASYITSKNYQDFGAKVLDPAMGFWVNRPASAGVPGTTVVAGVPITGFVVVMGATVTLDANDDGVCAVGEPTATTDAGGAFTFSASNTVLHMICVKGGIGALSGAHFNFEWKAPAGAPEITPLTTLVVAKMQADKAAGIITTPAAAATTIATALGLTGANLLAAAGGTNPQLIAVASRVQALLEIEANNLATAAAGTVPTSAQIAAMYDQAVKNMVASITAQAASLGTN